jgi:S1-C subfamily serine protease
VAEDSGAEKAGVRIDDVIVGVDGQAPGSIADVQRILADKKSGDVVALKIIRGGEEREITVQLQ